MFVTVFRSVFEARCTIDFFRKNYASVAMNWLVIHSAFARVQSE